MARILHTADLQLGMSRRFLGPDAQARYAQARLDTIRSLGELARADGAELIVVAGDVFEANSIDRQTVGRALDAFGGCGVPVFLLPGNHDPLDVSSVYRSDVFIRRCPANVHVLVDTSPVEVRPGLEVVGAPWSSKRPLHDLAAAAVADLAPAPGVTRILVAHGAVDAVFPERREPSLIRLAALDAALADGRIGFVALGDRHSLTSVGTSGRVWYSGTPEPCDFDETEPGMACVIDVDDDRCKVESRPVGAWRFVRRDARLAHPDDIDELDAWLTALPDKATTVVRLGMVGALALREAARLDTILDEHAELLAALDCHAPATELAVVPDAFDTASIGLGGFAASAFAELEEAAGDGGEGAGDALRLLYRLARKAA